MKTIISHSTEFEFYAVLISVLLVFAAYTFFTSRTFLNNLYPDRHTDDTYMHVLIQRFIGVIFFGIVFLFMVYLMFNKKPVSFGFRIPAKSDFLYIFMALSTLLVGVSYFNSRSQSNLKTYPQIRNRVWTTSMVLMNVITWTFYLFSYEFMFRGVLLFSTLRHMDLVYAIAINTVIYSVYHIPKGYKESITAIPFGIVLCYISYETGSFFYAFLMHLTLALSNDFFSLKAHPEIRTAFFKKP
jgi:membrane protease YdiL (CAAX protease family)